MTNTPTHAAAVPGSDERWLAAWANSADLAYCRDPGGRILEVNQAFAHKFGRAISAFVGMNATELLHTEEAARFLQTRAPVHGTAETRQRWVTPQGVRWLAWDETMISDASGAIVAIRAVGRDFTRQRLAEEQVYRLSRAAEQSPVSIIITDLDGRPQYVNGKFTEATGCTLEDLLDRDVAVLRNDHPDEASWQAFWTAVRGGGEWRGEVATRRPDGSTRWENVKVSCLRNPAGEITNFLCLREDVTERKQLERQLRQAQKMESLGALAGGIAHDFNNLLAVINGYAEFCQQGTPPPALLQKSLQEIHHAAMRASGLVRQILTFSRKTEVKFAPVDLNQLVRDLTGLVAETFPRMLSLRLELQDSLPPLLADTNQVQQIVLNLCVNARDAMPAGGTITLRTAVVPGASIQRQGADPARNYASFQVIDTGTGMSAETRQRLFEPFFTTKPAGQGTGLGLAVVYGIVVAHHGFIDVESELGRGSTFSVYLPLAETDAAVAARTARNDFPGGTETLLIVDDEESLRTLLSTALGLKGYTTVTARSGLEAIELVRDRARRFDAAVLDLNMPGATGVDVLKAIRQCRPQLQVVVVTGHLAPGVRVELERLGQHDFLQKPYTLHEVGRQLRRVLDASR